MNLKLLTKHSVIALVLAIVALVCSYLPWPQGLDDASYGIFSRLLTDSADPVQTTIVSVPPAHGGDPWSTSVSRVQLAQLIERIRRHAPAAIGISLALDAPQGVPGLAPLETKVAGLAATEQAQWRPLLADLDGDAALGRVIRRAGNIVLMGTVGRDVDGMAAGEHPSASVPARVEDGAEKGNPLRAMVSATRYILPPTFHLGSLPHQAFAAAGGVGLAEVTRRHEQRYMDPLVYRTPGGDLPSYHLALVARALGGAMPVYAEDTGLRLGQERIATDPLKRFYPRPAANARGRTQIPVVGADQVLHDGVAADLFKGRIVLIGRTEVAPEAEIAGPGIMQVSPVEWSAFAVDAIMARRAVTVPSWAYTVQRLSLGLVAIYLLTMPARLRSPVGLGISLIVFLLMVNASMVLLITRVTWVPLSYPALCLLAGHLVIYFRQRIELAISTLKMETEKAYRELAANHQMHGRLDDALNYLCKCSANDTVLESLYELGLDFERRRQFSKAASVYDRIAANQSDYRDIPQRIERIRVMPAPLISASGAASSAASATLVIDESSVTRPVIGRYIIEKEIGRGAMGMVYLGKDPKISRTVAIKTMALTAEFEAQDLEEVMRRFYQEAETAGKLSHPNIVTIYDVGEEHDLAYIAMDFIPGYSLDHYTEMDQLLPITEVLDIAVRMADALDYAHKHHVVHRDVKPANIIYDRDNRQLKMTDFGIAYLADNSKTRTGTILGSPSYMSPEQLAGNKVDGRSDLYSLGVTIFELLTGTLPFNADSVAALAYQIANDKPPNIRKLRPDLPRCLVKLINRALEKTVAKRFQTGGEFSRALEACRKSVAGK